MAEPQTQAISSDKTVFIATDEPERGPKGPFCVVYSTGDAESRWDYLCDSYDSFDTAVDTMAHIECNNCGNARRPEKQDAAYE